MTTEQTLQIEQNGEYKNITVKTRYQWDKNKKQFVFDADNKKIVVTQGVKPDHYTTFTKKFVEGRAVEGKYGTSYACMVEYGGEDVSFWLNEFQHQDFASAGGEGDTVKVSCAIEQKFNKKLGVEVPVEVLTFEVA